LANFERFENIDAWKKARILVKEIYMISSKPKFNKDYGLREQIRRAAVSVVSNIAEGFERGGNKEFRQFLSIAKGSVGEVKTQLYVALDVELISEVEFSKVYKQADEVGKIINGLMDYLKRTDLKGSKNYR
jgi:four helix bundle protein